MSVAFQKVTKWAVSIPDRVMDGTGTEKSAWIVPTQFHAARYVNGAKYFVAQITLVEERVLQTRRKDVDFEQTFFPNGPQYFAGHKIVRLRALQNISEREEVHAAYGKSYKFPA